MPAAILVTRETYKDGCAALEVDKFVAIDACMTACSTLKWANSSKTSKECHTKLFDNLRTSAGISPNTTSVASATFSKHESAPSSATQLGGSEESKISNSIQVAEESAKSQTGGLEVGDYILLHVTYSDCENNGPKTSIAEDGIEQQTAEMEKGRIIQDFQMQSSPCRSSREEGFARSATSAASPPCRAGSCPPLGSPAIPLTFESFATGESTLDAS